MKCLDLTITALSPLAIGQRKPGGSVSEAMDYIPGTVIRGAIASKILQHAQATGQITLEQTDLTQADNDSGKENDFRKLFLDEQSAIFLNGYPAIAKLGEDNYEASLGEVRVLPATALSAKSDSGFKPKKAGVFDALIDSFCAQEQSLFYEPNGLEGERVEPFSGFYSHYGEWTDTEEKTHPHYVSHSVSKRLLTRVALNRRRATAQDELLYSLEVMNESQGKTKPQPTVFKSSILIKDEALATALQTFITQNRDQFRLGGAVSRGLGQVKLCTKLKDAEYGAADIEKRIEAFNQRLQERWEKWSQFGSGKDIVKGRTFFSLGLESDAILTENWRRTMVISEAMLASWLGLAPTDLTLHMIYSSHDYRSGWNAAWGLPKDVELVTKMGSVFLFSIPTAKLNNGYEPFVEGLARLETLGIGKRTNEGFGQVKICDEFHKAMREDPV